MEIANHCGYAKKKMAAGQEVAKQEGRNQGTNEKDDLTKRDNRGEQIIRAEGRKKGTDKPRGLVATTGAIGEHLRSHQAGNRDDTPRNQHPGGVLYRQGDRLLEHTTGATSCIMKAGSPDDFDENDPTANRPEQGKSGYIFLLMPCGAGLAAEVVPNIQGIRGCVAPKHCIWRTQ
ncbi:hypothetical protein VTK73DRAFT_3163 [Phialemonium thermophilum]|uniref:Uncharacterized protein n=1 Tax=Phialemonium thermophilum TaxID=223376 RepID=A0ABR3X150_9PEZI